MEWVLLIVLVLAGMAWWGKRSEEKAPAGRASAPPPPPRSRTDGRLVRLSCDGRLSVVGESHYQPALKAAAGGRTVPDGAFDQAIPVRATLVPEPKNPHDRKAVRVDVDGRTVGYLAREDAARYQPMLLRLDGVGWCEARIMGGKSRPYGIFLCLGSPERLTLANGSAGIEILEAERMVTVTGEEKHQDVLERLDGEGRDGVFPPVVATFAVSEVSRGKYAGEPCIEVRIDGERVGELTRKMSERYLPTIEGVFAGGGTPGCEAFVRRVEGKGIQVELRMPPI